LTGTTPSDEGSVTNVEDVFLEDCTAERRMPRTLERSKGERSAVEQMASRLGVPDGSRNVRDFGCGVAPVCFFRAGEGAIRGSGVASPEVTSQRYSTPRGYRLRSRFTCLGGFDVPVPFPHVLPARLLPRAGRSTPVSWLLGCVVERHALACARE
jgi:hypothetical protein